MIKINQRKSINVLSFDQLIIRNRGCLILRWPGTDAEAGPVSPVPTRGKERHNMWNNVINLKPVIISSYIIIYIYILELGKCHGDLIDAYVMWKYSISCFIHEIIELMI